MNGQEKYPPIHINVPSTCLTATGTTLTFALAFALASALAIFLALILIGFVLILSPCLLLLWSTSGCLVSRLLPGLC